VVFKREEDYQKALVWLHRNSEFYSKYLKEVGKVLESDLKNVRFESWMDHDGLEKAREQIEELGAVYHEKIEIAEEMFFERFDFEKKDAHAEVNRRISRKRDQKNCPTSGYEDCNTVLCPSCNQLVSGLQHDNVRGYEVCSGCWTSDDDI
jgi:hypothetical protein